MVVNYRRMVRFGPGTISIIAALLIIGVALIYLGYSRMIANAEGGGTFLLLGVVIILVDLFILLGIATTRVSRVEKKYHNLSSLVGRRGIVKQEIPRGGRGVVLVENELWTATSDEYLEEGAKIKIINIEGVILHVLRDT
jgi:membrane protein implicated in regulation of membrane protease activity